jgi:hypothetical protein
MGGGTWDSELGECGDVVNVEFREEIGSRVILSTKGRDTLTRSKVNGLNSRSELVLYGNYLFTRPALYTIYTSTLTHILCPAAIPQPICKHVIPPFCLKAAVN